MSSGLPAIRPTSQLMPSIPARRLVRQAQEAALVEAARIEAAAYVTYAGLHAVANLSEVEARLVQRSPLAERRLAYIGNVGAARIAAIIEGMR